MITHEQLIALMVKRGLITEAESEGKTDQANPNVWTTRGYATPEPEEQKFVKINGQMVPAHLVGVVRANNKLAKLKPTPPKAGAGKAGAR